MKLDVSSRLLLKIPFGPEVEIPLGLKGSLMLFGCIGGFFYILFNGVGCASSEVISSIKEQNALVLTYRSQLAAGEDRTLTCQKLERSFNRLPRAYWGREAYEIIKTCNGD